MKTNASDERPAIVLSYANPLASQPVGGRLKLERDERGLTLTDTKSSATSSALIRGVGVVMLFVATIVLILLLISSASQAGSDLAPHIVAALVGLVCGIMCVTWANQVKPIYSSIRLERDTLIESHGTGVGWLPDCLKIRRFIAVPGSIDLRSQKPLCSVDVSYFRGVSIRLFTRLSTDEALWAVHELEQERTKDAAAALEKADALEKGDGEGF